MRRTIYLQLQAHLLTGTFAAFAALLAVPAATGLRADEVDFRYRPKEWQSAICLPDDPQKSLVDKSGELLYHFRRGGREFDTRISVEVTPDAKWKGQTLVDPRVPIVQTRLETDDLEILQEAFAVTDMKPTTVHAPAPIIQRLDNGGSHRNWAKPMQGLDPRLSDIVLRSGGLQYSVSGEAYKIGLVLCEGWWDQPGKRIQVLKVEGAEPKTVDTVADIGKNKAQLFWFDGRDLDTNGRIVVNITPAEGSSDTTMILNALWVFAPGAKVDSAAVLSGKPDVAPTGRMSLVNRSGPARNDLLMVEVTNRGKQAKSVAPVLVIDTTLDCRKQGSRIVLDGHETVAASREFGEASTGTNSTIHRFALTPFEVPAGASQKFFVQYSGGSAIVTFPSNMKEAERSRRRAVDYWQDAPLPYGRIEVPDAQIQALVDSSIRNIWQAREIKDGLPVFQVGPTVYRGLWVVDGAFLLESAAILGAGKDARGGITYTLSHQKPSGAFQLLAPKFYKENGIVIWTCVRHAMLTQDKAWLESVWPKLEASAGYILELRRRSYTEGTPLDDGINPPGEIDGGLWNRDSQHSEFSNVHWNLAGLKALVQAAEWLGKADSATRWSKEYEGLYGAFRKAWERDARKDPYGNTYVPIFMNNAGYELPQRGQWTFCHAVYPGQLFSSEDQLVRGGLAMLQATEREGMVYGTGWDPKGLWNYFASFYGHAWLWQGNGKKAAQVLYAFGNHAAPVLDWREEQSLLGEPFRKVGDMPHNWASAEFIRLTTHLLALDRGDEMHLLEGMPAEWLKPGMITRLRGIATPFGPLNLSVRVDPKGETAVAEVSPLRANCKSIIVHLPNGQTEQLSPARGGKVKFPVAGLLRS